jgi:1-acyl-sn-glycerol-3-phosphate acyltransferase
MIYIEQKGNFISGLKQSADVLRQGKSLIIFPEGERSTNGEPGEFKKGGAFLAKTLNKKVQPVTIRPLTRTRVGDYGSGRHLLVHDPIDPDKYQNIDTLNDEIKSVIISGLNFKQ